MFLKLYIKILELFFGSYYHSNISSCYNLILFSLNFINQMKVFSSSKLKMVCFCWCNLQSININFDEKSLFCFNKFNKRTKLHQFSKIQD